MSIRLIELLEKSSTEVELGASSTPAEITRLLLLKLETTLRHARHSFTNSSEADPTSEAAIDPDILQRLETIENRLVGIELQLRAAQALSESQQAKSDSATSLDAELRSKPEKHRRGSMSLSRRELFDELVSLQIGDSKTSGSREPGEGSLRKRSTTGGQAPGDGSTLARLADENEEQNDLAGEVLEMVQAIRRNAEEFQKKLAQDSGVVDAASDSVDGAVVKMSSVQKKLGKYRSSTALGWGFYIKATIFIVVGLIVGMLLIQLFPKFRR